MECSSSGRGCPAVWSSRNCTGGAKWRRRLICGASRRSVGSGVLATGLLMASSGNVLALDSAVSSLVSDVENPLESKVLDFTQPGPFRAAKLPSLEHTCAACFPKCVGDRCLLRISVTYPAGNTTVRSHPPYPLAIISGGFLVKGRMYQSYAERLATWGYVAIVYDKVESILDALDDVISAAFIQELIDYCQRDSLLQQLVDPEKVYLIGHSRGGKVSVLAAADDTRVAGLCLIDPVDNTVYAPISPGFPSAVAAMKSWSRSIPIAIVGGGKAADCAPRESNYRKFFDATTDNAWEVVLKDAGHFQFLDGQSSIQEAVCIQGEVSDELVRYVAQAVMISWGESIFHKMAINSAPRLTSSKNTLDTLQTNLVAQAYKREQYRNTIVYIPKCNDASLLLDRAGAQMIELKDESSPVTNGTYDGGIPLRVLRGMLQVLIRL